MSIQAMKMALYFLDRLQFDERDREHDAAITALRAAITEAEKVEPVAWVYYPKGVGEKYVTYTNPASLDLGKQADRIVYIEPLYTTPQPAIPAGLQVTLDYTVLHQYADDIGINYNDLCAIVRTSIIGFAVPKPENGHD